MNGTGKNNASVSGDRQCQRRPPGWEGAITTSPEKCDKDQLKE